VSETYAGRMLRVYAELSEREVKALAIENGEHMTSVGLARWLRDRNSDAVEERQS
jgi:hypothetical protein